MKVIINNKYQKKNSSLTVLSLLFFIVAITPSLPAKAIANSHLDINNTVLFQPPPEEEQPEETEGAASRQSRKCDQDVLVTRQQKIVRDRTKLTAIVPNGNSGLTTKKRPTFWVYLPQTTARRAILSIKEGANPHWQQSINLTGKAGVMGIKLPKNAPALEIGKNYQWAVILVCGNRPNPNDPVTVGGIKRIDKSQTSSNELINPMGLENAAWYARQGIWYDALNILIASRSSLVNWNDIWVRYLQSGGLSEITNEPFVK